MKRLFLIFCVFSLLSFVWLDNTSAAPPQYYNYDTAGDGNSFPFNTISGKRVQLLYLPGDLNQPSAAPSGTITSVAFRIHDSLGIWTYSNFTIRMGQSSITSFAAGAFYGSLTTVYNRSSVDLQGIAGDWMTINLDSPFTYNPTQSLVVDIEQTGVPGATGFSASFTPGPDTDNRRIWSRTGATSIYENANNSIYHFGINLTPSSTTTTTVNCTPDPVAINQGTICTAAVTDTSSSGATAPTGTVTFSTDSSGGFTPANTCTLGSPTSNSSSCSVTYTPSGSAGTHNIGAGYGGNSTHGSSTATAYSLTVNLRTTTTTVISCTSPISIGQSSTCTAVVTDTFGTGATPPEGTVTFSVDPPGSGTFDPNPCTLAPQSANTSSCSTLYTPSHASTHIISGSYSGSTVHDASSTTTETDFDLNVNTLAVPTMNQWGMIIFMMLAGCGAGYYLRRHRKSES